MLSTFEVLGDSLYMHHVKSYPNLDQLWGFMAVYVQLSPNAKFTKSLCMPNIADLQFE